MLKSVVIPLHVVLTGCAAAETPRPPPSEPVAAAPAPAPAPPAAPAADAAVRAEIERLKARAAVLEKELNAAPLADVTAMLEMIPRGQAAELSRELEKHLLRGEPGHAVLYEFFRQSDIQHEKIDVLTHHPQFIYAILRLVGLYPNECAEASRHLIKASKENPESWVRRELYNFIPVFILHHAGRYPELKRELEEDIVHQIQMGGTYLYKMALAMKDLEFQPPVDIFLPILLDPARREFHGSVIEILAGRQQEGLSVLSRYLDEAKELKTPTAGAVIAAIQKIEQGKPGGKISALLEHSNADLRRAATYVYFEQARDETDLPRALDVLNSPEATPVQKRAFISLIAQRSPELFKVIFDQADAHITDTATRMQVRRTAEALSRRKARKAGETPATPPRQAAGSAEGAGAGSSDDKAKESEP